VTGANLGPVVWNAQIAAGALAYSANCQFEHSSDTDRTYNGIILGENLAYGSPYSAYSDQAMVDMWGNEKQYYTYPQYPSQSSTGETGHYTQIINKNVTEIGCGCTNCSGSKLCVCRYNPIQLGNQPPY
jgi:uncharacterized protein YkwD